MTPQQLQSVIDQLLTQISDSPQVPHAEEYLSDLLENGAKLFNDLHDHRDIRLIINTVRELRRALRLFQSYRDVRKVCVFGSARTPATDPEYILAQQFAQQITALGYMIITGAGSGIMEAGNRGAEVDTSFGVNIELPFEQSANPFIADSSKNMTFRYFFTRKLIFMKESDATILFPGGFGTHDEAFECMTLMQTGKVSPRPLVLLDSPTSTYWSQWMKFITDQLEGRGFISPGDATIAYSCKSVSEAVAYITGFYRNYHSIRHLDHCTIIRTERPVSDALLKFLNTQFSDILSSGQFERLASEKNTMDSHYYTENPRLIFKFDKLRFSRLVALVHALNQE